MDGFRNPSYLLKALPVTRYMPLILYHTNPCSHTPAIKRVAAAAGADCEFRAETAENLAQLDGAVYQTSPILVDGEKVVEDWRLIVRHIDELYGGGKLTAIPPARRSELFDLCEEIDRRILRPAALFMIPPSVSAGRALLAPFLGSKAAADSNGNRAGIIAEVTRISEDPRMKAGDFALARLLLDGALEFLRRDSELSSKLPA